ncbi:helix-turn-helix transcriptional regulator [Roseateles amylovorans]|uniref:MarR family transcriptional regulator n=1 Tax=Roseateles amylovorans TaxID=2978473 RepID=A0ABY6B502_9BURK|nr:MarR family transcriptional regulator [Roseateles amylovorans]UXH80446.1 MarR family transcriptional regulator [Roseateles amylovorans]
MTVSPETGNEDRLLFELKRSGALPAATLAAACAITPMGAHKLLGRLEAQGLVVGREDHGDAPRVGRPRKLWALTAAGHGRFPDRHADLTVQLVHQVRTVLGEAALDQLIAARERDSDLRYTAALARCRSAGDRLRELARLRADEGYMARVERQGRDWVLIEDHCPICAAAQSCQGFCRSELALFQRCLGPDWVVARTEHLLAGARRCAYRISAAAVPGEATDAPPQDTM